MHADKYFVFNQFISGFSNRFLETLTLFKTQQNPGIKFIDYFYPHWIGKTDLILHLEFHFANIQSSNSCKNSKIDFQCFSNKKQTKWRPFYSVIVLELIQPWATQIGSRAKFAQKCHVEAKIETFSTDLVDFSMK